MYWDEEESYIRTVKDGSESFQSTHFNKIQRFSNMLIYMYLNNRKQAYFGYQAFLLVFHRHLMYQATRNRNHPIKCLKQCILIVKIETYKCHSMKTRKQT